MEELVVRKFFIGSFLSCTFAASISLLRQNIERLVHIEKRLTTERSEQVSIDEFDTVAPDEGAGRSEEMDQSTSEKDESAEVEGEGLGEICAEFPSNPDKGQRTPKLNKKTSNPREKEDQERPRGTGVKKQRESLNNVGHGVKIKEWRDLLGLIMILLISAGNSLPVFEDPEDVYLNVTVNEKVIIRGTATQGDEMARWIYSPESDPNNYSTLYDSNRGIWPCRANSYCPAFNVTQSHDLIIAEFHQSHAGTYTLEITCPVGDNCGLQKNYHLHLTQASTTYVPEKTESTSNSETIVPTSTHVPPTDRIIWIASAIGIIGILSVAILVGYLLKKKKSKVYYIGLPLSLRKARKPTCAQANGTTDEMI